MENNTVKPAPLGWKINLLFLLALLALAFIGWHAIHIAAQTPARSYQIQLQDSTALLYDGKNLVGRFKLEGELDSLIINDNQ